MLRARVQKGRLVLDEPTDLPEGTILELVPVQDWDDLDDDERAQLHASLERGWQQAQAGQTRPAEDFLRELKQRR